MPTTLRPTALRAPLGLRLSAFVTQCKPRVNSLIVFTAVIGMFLAQPGWPPAGLMLAATVGIALVAGAAASIVRSTRQLIARCPWA